MSDAPAQSRSRVFAGAAFIVAVTLVAYLPAIRGGFIWDDDQYVTENRLLRSVDGLRLIWTTIGATPQYYPLTHTSFWIEHQLWGTKPLGYHLTNVLLHIGSALLLWRILVMLGLRGAWLAAAIFAVHPIEVESGAWITERKNVLAGVFYFGSMLCYLYASRDGNGLPGMVLGKPRWGWYSGSLALFVAAVLSKTIAGTLPAALLLILWWRSGRIPWKPALYLLPMFGLALVMGSITGWMEREFVGARGPEWELSLAERILIAGRAVWFYAAKIVLPINLTFIYPRWDIDVTSFLQWLYPMALVAVLCGLFALRGRVGRGPLTAVLYFVGTLVPALGFVNVYPMRFSFVADHFQYLAGVGLIALIAELLIRVTRARDAMVLFPVPLVLAVLTWSQAHMYRDAQTLWQTTLDRNPDAWIAHDHLGAILAASDLEAALGHYATAQQLNPDHMEGYIGMGNLLLQIGRTGDAAEQYRKAIGVRPDSPTPYYGLGVALDAAAEPEGAIAAYHQALAADDRFIPARMKLVDLYTRLGRGDDAAREIAEIERQRRRLLGR